MRTLIASVLALACVLTLCGLAPAQCPGGVCRVAPVVYWQPQQTVAVWNQQYPTVVRFVPAPTPLNPWPHPVTYYQPAQDARAVLVPVWPQHPAR